MKSIEIETQRNGYVTNRRSLTHQNIFRVFIASVFKLVNYFCSQKSCERRGKSGKTEFHCPVCREVVTPPVPSVKYQEWAQQFPLNHLLVALMDQSKLKAKVKLCDPCKAIDDAPAVSWCVDCNEAMCQNCTSVHKRQKMSRDHVLKKIDEMQTKPLITSLQMCENHKGKSVEAFCSDHNQPCCATCVAIHHRKCDHVTTLEEAARGILKSKDLSELLQRLKDTSTINQTLIKDKRENIKALEDQKARIEKELQNARQRVIENFDKQHSTFMRTFSQKHNTKIQEMTVSIKEIENRDKAIQNCTNLIEVCMTRSSETRVFLEMKKVIQKEEEQIKALEQIQTKHKRIDYDFKLDKDLDKLVNDFETVGEVDIMENSKSLTESYPRMIGGTILKECLPKLISSFSVRDKCGVSSYVYRMCCMPDNKLLLPLYDSKNLAVVNANGDLIKQINVNPRMFDVTVLDSNTAVSTHGHYGKKLSFINTKTLTVNKTIDLGVWCYAITCSDNKLYIGCYNKLMILDNHGNTQEEISTNGIIFGITIFKFSTKKDHDIHMR
ncbi:hypothetical protein KUTeg_010982 [Tegillarca granosa]|uniref:B box-type domain-containing protein n=1 Tax=Tegillarca granosa TaxID=220873 RepID=A0ABQ9F5S9_TEGGR|nr:hypothetical protein KUTeg_010982 [Tegillarca granosa]